MPELDQLDQASDSAPDSATGPSPPSSSTGALVACPFHQSEGLQRIRERMRARVHPLLLANGAGAILTEVYASAGA